MDFRALAFERVTRVSDTFMRDCPVAIASDGEHLTVLYTDRATEAELYEAVRRHTFDGKRVTDVDIRTIVELGVESQRVSVRFR